MGTAQQGNKGKPWVWPGNEDVAMGNGITTTAAAEQPAAELAPAFLRVEVSCPGAVNYSN